MISIIRELSNEMAENYPGIKISIGDDAALFHFSGGDVLLTTDCIFEGIHFNLDTHSLSDVGWKAAACGVSDIAAMGGQPLCVLMSLAYSEPLSEEQIRSLLGGFIEMLETCNCALIGGDVSRSRSGLSLVVTVAGVPHIRGSVRRSGAKVGDLIGLTGHTGDSAAGLYILSKNDEKLRARFPELVESHLRPKPRVEAGWIIASAGASAMEDTSDGLARDLLHICEESKLGCILEERLLPVSQSLVSLAEHEGEDPFEWFMGGGEDFELVFTASEKAFGEISRCCGERGIPVTMIGRMVSANEGSFIVRKDGSRVNIENLGYEHFA